MIELKIVCLFALFAFAADAKKQKYGYGDGEDDESEKSSCPSAVEKKLPMLYLFYVAVHLILYEKRGQIEWDGSKVTVTNSRVNNVPKERIGLFQAKSNSTTVLEAVQTAAQNYLAKNERDQMKIEAVFAETSTGVQLPLSMEMVQISYRELVAILYKQE